MLCCEFFLIKTACLLCGGCKKEKLGLLSNVLTTARLSNINIQTTIICNHVSNTFFLRESMKLREIKRVKYGI